VPAVLREAEAGNATLAKQDISAALALAPGRDVKILAALALARIGDAARTRPPVEGLEKSDQSNTVLKVYWLPTINAAVSLNQGKSAEAPASLEAISSYELSSAGPLYPPYVRGQAYLLTRNGLAAAAEFRKLLDHRGIVLNFVTSALAHLQLGRAYVMSGDTPKARTAYQDFLALWKDADPDVPILKQAKVEYTKLQ
jgi:eukaryotic-like serine/threonine-protein kinase